MITISTDLLVETANTGRSGRTRVLADRAVHLPAPDNMDLAPKLAADIAHSLRWPDDPKPVVQTCRSLA